MITPTAIFAWGQCGVPCYQNEKWKSCKLKQLSSWEPTKAFFNEIKVKKASPQKVEQYIDGHTQQGSDLSKVPCYGCKKYRHYQSNCCKTSCPDDGTNSWRGSCQAHQSDDNNPHTKTDDQGNTFWSDVNQWVKSFYYAHHTDEHQLKSSLPAVLRPIPVPATTSKITHPAANLAAAPNDGHTFQLISGYLACLLIPPHASNREKGDWWLVCNHWSLQWLQ